MCLMPYANNQGAVQPAHPRSLIINLVVRCLDSTICILAIGVRSCENVSYAICEQSRRSSACASAQSDQQLGCSLLR